MPKGIPIKDHLDNPDFKILYSTIKHSNLKDTDFAAVAKEMGIKDAAFARGLLNRTMNAQGKTTTSKKAAAGTKPAPATAPKTPPVKTQQAASPARPVKKRKFSKTESEEDDAEANDESGGKDESDTEAADDD